MHRVKIFIVKRNAKKRVRDSWLVLTAFLPIAISTFQGSMLPGLLTKVILENKRVQERVPVDLSP